MTTTETKRTALKIRGMTCAMCSKTVEHALADLDGVVVAEVNLGNETASVEYLSLIHISEPTRPY